MTDSDNSNANPPVDSHPPKKDEPKKSGHQDNSSSQDPNQQPQSSGNGTAEEGQSKDEKDFLGIPNIDAFKTVARRASAIIKSVLGLDLNSYATKKSLAQGILDLALLAANASQLKFILTMGEKHEFYQLLLWLVVSSICLQAIQAVLCVVLALVLNINKVDEQKAANIINNVSLSIIVLIVIVNVIITGFDIKSSNNPVPYHKIPETTADYDE